MKNPADMLDKTLATYARENPAIFLGPEYYRTLVRTGKAGEALSGAVLVSGDKLMLVALAAAAEHAAQYLATMTPRRREALAQVATLERQLSAARAELVEAEREDACWGQP